MPWNSTYPVGSISVKNNRPLGQQNTTYIETTMGNSIVGTNTATTRDHFWNVGTDEDGRHRFIQSPAFTVGLNPTDPVVGTGMNGVLYLKTTNNIPQWFHRPSTGNIYQATPNFLQGTVNITGSYSNIVAVPASVYGEIWLWRTALGKNNAQNGFFRSDATTVEAWANYLAPQGSGASENLKLGNGSDASGLNIRVRTADASSGNDWQYRIIYRAI